MAKVNVDNLTNSAFQVFAKELAKHGVVSPYGEKHNLVRQKLKELIQELASE